MDDLIRRQDAMEEIRESASKYTGFMEMELYTADDAVEAIEGVPSEQPVQRWIPCSERLPNCNGCYLVWRPHFYSEIGFSTVCYFDGQNTWHDAYGVDFTRILQPDDVTAWMPLPEPYIKE